MLPLKALTGIFKSLQSTASPWQIAGGVGLGLLLGFQPLTGPQSVFLLLLIFLLNVNLGSAFLAAGLFAGLAALLDPVAHALGYALLVQADFLAPLWTALYNAPLVPFTRFNHTVVLGSLVLSLLLLAPVLWGARGGVLYYRTHLQSKVDRSGFMRWFKLTRVWNLWDKVKR